ncbi:Uma2 family endonuclease [Sorangium sp. So ce1036]|uniref:Uma2 family endonuclease n=1 Tax=Sorangium sp. So ce1036 TaxID=3133328 RepID=UPI003F024408
MTQAFSSLPYHVDPADPRAPSVDQWRRMTPEEQARVVDMLPSELPIELWPPEGDVHRKAKESPVQALSAFFQRTGRKVYISSELPVYYPGERVIAPDVLAVMDVEPHERSRWVVQREGKGLDLVIEVHVAGDAHKDHVERVERYARLGILEYFVFDRARLRLHGYRLPEGARQYQPILPQRGRYPSHVLGLELSVEGDKLRAFAGTAALPDAGEMIAQLESSVNEVVAHKEEAERRADAEAERAAELERKLVLEAERAQQEAERAQQEAERASALERRLAQIEAELARLKQGR